MKREARRILLPILEITEIASPSDKNAIKVPLSKGGTYFEYYVRKKHDEVEGNRTDHKPSWMRSEFNLYPIVLDKNGVPWAEANIYLLSRIESSISPTMSTYASIADSLAAFRRFLDETEIDWTDFPSHKLKRPTYRYHSYLKLEIASGRLKASTAKRRMSAVISFYSWLKQEGTLTPTNLPWKESDRYIQLVDLHGFKFSKHITSTDVSIKTTQSQDPYDKRIDDGGKLKPLTTQEQEWLIDSLISLGNTEMLLIHLLGLVTGARIQTILTMRIKHVSAEFNSGTADEVRLPAGPGTDIDTKNDKKIIIHIPIWLYKKLNIYAKSERAKKRRARSDVGENESQYLFLSVRGSPLYKSKSDSLMFNQSYSIRHAKAGQGVRQFITDRVIPLIRTKNNAPDFHYQFHDTRASYGMNLTDRQLERVSIGEITLHQAREFVKARMSHESSATTDRYLQYRSNLEIVSNINARYDEHLKNLVDICL
ncbi:site-specific integrase [Methylomonas sp. 11b]|uniref:site-specific integrase n=1 Tax=Methylomonas sp. 11b TaxID=1168169 RepID=UPI00047902F8|nr:site-specific integrase [Methylomonas sp. 11b]